MSALITTRTGQVGPYVIESRLATGGQATVYLAQHQAAHDAGTSRVVLKVPRDGATFIRPAEALHRERKALAGLVHPHLVQLIDHDLTADPPYLVLEYVDGLDLHRLLRFSAPGNQGVPEDLACFICHRLALALSNLHGPATRDAPLVYHGDVSPSNILLSTRGEVKLSDFGLAVRTDGAPSSERRATNPPPPHTIWGHRGYLAAERMAGGSPSSQADVFALTVVLCELLTGGAPFPGDGEFARLLAMKEGRLAPSLEREGAVSPELLAVCRRGLSPDPALRPPVAEFAHVLQSRLRVGPSTEQSLERSLSAWVKWGQQQLTGRARHTGRVRDSVRVLRASRTISGMAPRAESDAEEACLRTANSPTARKISYSELVGLAVAGKLDPRDEVALSGETYEPVSNIPALARHLRPSSAALTSEVSPLGPPDYCEQLANASLIPWLGRSVTKKATGLLVVERPAPHRQERREVYILEGRVTHVTASGASDRLGESLVQAGVLSRPELSRAVRHMVETHGQLGESLVALGLVDPVVVYHALSVQARDRIVQLCTWDVGVAQFYASVARPEVSFPLDVDLHACLVHAVDLLGAPPPAAHLRVLPLKSCPEPRSAPSTLPLLNLVPSIARKRLAVSTAIEELSTLSARSVTTKPVTYLVVARTLGWIDFA